MKEGYYWAKKDGYWMIVEVETVDVYLPGLEYPYKVSDFTDYRLLEEPKE